ncbi:MAG: hypothetical protein KDC12_09235 [Flavobacteriales bacterium]|nr:hypothetical protein [Flavobacteriales bacterium]
MKLQSNFARGGLDFARALASAHHPEDNGKVVNSAFFARTHSKNKEIQENRSTT